MEIARAGIKSAQEAGSGEFADPAEMQFLRDNRFDNIIGCERQRKYTKIIALLLERAGIAPEDQSFSSSTNMKNK